MSNEIVNALNTATGRVGKISRRQFERHSNVLVEVDADQKPYEPTLFRSRSASEFLAEKARLTEPALDPADHPEPESDEDAADTDSKDTE